MAYQTTAAYVSGAICGDLWWPVGERAGTLICGDLRREFDRFSCAGATFRNVLELILSEHGGDFQGAAFTSDTVVRIERRRVDGAGQYSVHVREREIGALADCADLIADDAYVCDFMGDDQ